MIGLRSPSLLSDNSSSARLQVVWLGFGATGSICRQPRTEACWASGGVGVSAEKAARSSRVFQLVTLR